MSGVNFYVHLTNHAVLGPYALPGVDAVVAKLTKQPKIKNPFKPGKNFSLKAQGEMYADPKTRNKAVGVPSWLWLASNLESPQHPPNHPRLWLNSSLQPLDGARDPGDPSARGSGL